MAAGQYTESYIAFLDMLGFKNLIQDSSCEEVLSKFDSIKKPFEGCSLAYHQDILVPKKTMDAIHIKVMSDSICFYVDAAEANALMGIIMSCVRFQFELLNLPGPIFVRGAIVKGELYAKGDIIFGPGLTQAYLMEERNAKYPRIILTNAVVEDARRENAANTVVLNALEKSTAFRDFDAFYTLNFAHAFHAWDKSGRAYANLAEKVKQTLDTTTDESVREKHLYVERVLKERYNKKTPAKP